MNNYSLWLTIASFLLLLLFLFFLVATVALAAFATAIILSPKSMNSPEPLGEGKPIRRRHGVVLLLLTVAMAGLTFGAYYLGGAIQEDSVTIVVNASEEGILLNSVDPVEEGTFRYTESEVLESGSALYGGGQEQMDEYGLADGHPKPIFVTTDTALPNESFTGTEVTFYNCVAESDHIECGSFKVK